MSGSGRESVRRGPAGPTRTLQHLMSLRSQSASDVEHGSTRDVVDGSPVCAEAQHDYSDPWDDDEVPSEQPWHRQLQRGNDGSGEYDEQIGYDPSEYDDNDVTLGGDAHPAN